MTGLFLKGAGHEASQLNQIEQDADGNADIEAVFKADRHSNKIEHVDDCKGDFDRPAEVHRTFPFR